MRQDFAQPAVGRLRKRLAHEKELCLEASGCTPGQEELHVQGAAQHQVRFQRARDGYESRCDVSPTGAPVQHNRALQSLLQVLTAGLPEKLFLMLTATLNTC